MSLPNLSWMESAKELLGTKEVQGRGSNPEIVEWAKTIGGFVAKYYTSDDIPWCGLFVAHCLSENGLKIPGNPLSALDYAKWGLGLNHPSYGAIMVFTRNGGGHVGFYVGEDDEAYHILGGNQSDMVDVTRVGKDRLHAVRWPAEAPQEFTGPYQTEYSGPLSVNEA